MLPASRNRTYGTDTHLHPGDMNDLQDAVVAAKHGDIEIVFSGFSWLLLGATTGSHFFNPVQLALSSSGNAIIDLQAVAGRRVKSIQFSMKGDGAADVTAATVRKVSALGVETVLGTPLVVNNEPALWAVKTIDIPDTILGAGESLSLTVTTNATGIVLGNVSVFCDKP